jgi:hypothetical protein
MDIAVAHAGLNGAMLDGVLDDSYAMAQTAHAPHQPRRQSRHQETAHLAALYKTELCRSFTETGARGLRHGAPLRCDGAERCWRGQATADTA